MGGRAVARALELRPQLADRASYIDAFFANLDWDVVNGWVEQYGVPS